MGKFELDGRSGRRRHRHGHDPNDFFGIDVERMSPKAQVVTSLAVLIPVVVGLGLVIALSRGFLWWLVFVFGWTIFPAFALFVRGIAGLTDERPRLSSPDIEARQLDGSSRGGELQNSRAASTPALIGPKTRIALGIVALMPALMIGAQASLSEPGPMILLVEPLRALICFVAVLLSSYLIVSGVRGLSDTRSQRSIPATNSGERELLNALREHGELSSARAAMETLLTVAEADEIFKRLAEGGHLDVRVRGGGMFYALWENEDADTDAGEPLRSGV